MLRRFAPYLVAVALAVVSVFGVMSAPAGRAGAPRADYVVLAGAAGLRWDDLSPSVTPTLWALAQRGAIGALSVRSAHTPTCPPDGWVTLGAGNLARRTGQPAPAGCVAARLAVDRPDSIGANLPDQQQVVQLNRRLPYGAQPGALAEAVRCTAAVGPGAALAGARPFGRVDRYLDRLPDNPAAFLSSCVLSIVDLGTVGGADPAVRSAAARTVDAALAVVLAHRPSDSLVLVAGLSDTDETSRLHVAIADGPGYRGGWLISQSTSRPGYLQLADLAPTALAVLGKPAPVKLFTGQAAARTGGRPADLTAAVASLSDADREAGAQHRVGGWFFAVLTVAELVLFAAVVPLLRRARRHARADALRPVPARLVRVVEIALVAAALAIPAALLADAVPWWRSTLAGTLFTLTALALTAGLTVAVVSGPWYRGTLGPAGAVGTVAATVVGLDVVTGARLQLNGVAGYSALDGHRFAGMGTVALGLFCAGVLLVAGTVAQQVARRWRPAVVACLGAVAIVLVGSPYLGADAGGAIALTAGVCVAAAISTGGWLTFARLAWATLAGIAVTTGFALLDLRRPPAEQGSLGRFLAQAQDGTSGAAVHRASVANVAAVTDSPLTLVVLGAAVLVGVAMLAPWGGLKRLFGLRPAIRGALIGLAVATLLGGAVDGAGLRVAGAAVAVAVPVAALAALRVLDHADDRTVAAVAVPVPPGGPVPPVGPVAPDRPPGDPAAVERDDEPDTDVPPRQRRGDVLL